jgi:hypothetical protein
MKGRLNDQLLALMREHPELTLREAILLRRDTLIEQLRTATARKQAELKSL